MWSIIIGRDDEASLSIRKGEGIDGEIRKEDIVLIFECIRCSKEVYSIKDENDSAYIDNEVFSLIVDDIYFQFDMDPYFDVGMFLEEINYACKDYKLEKSHVDAIVDRFIDFVKNN